MFFHLKISEFQIFAFLEQHSASAQLSKDEELLRLITSKLISLTGSGLIEIGSEVARVKGPKLFIAKFEIIVPH